MLKRAIRAILPQPGEDLPKPLTEADMPGLIKPLQTKEDLFFLNSRGVSWNWAAENGWRKGATGRWAGRLVIPIKEGGRTYSWVARAMDDSKPKELHGPNTSKFLYGLDQYGLGQYPASFCFHKDWILVEGIFDQIKIASFFKHSLALMGSSMSDIQIGKLLKLLPSKVILMMDGDEAGRKATETIAVKLGKRMNPLDIQKVYLPEGWDPDNLTKSQMEELLK